MTAAYTVSGQPAATSGRASSGRSAPLCYTLPRAGELPSDLTRDKNYVLWYYNRHKLNSHGEPSKQPFSATTGKAQEWQQPDNWTSVGHALSEARRRGNCGIGYVLRAGGGVVGIDYDDCLDADGNITSETVKRLVHEAASYCEVSPSKTGLKQYVGGSTAGPLMAELPDGAKIEVYSENHFFTVTGQRWGPWTEIKPGGFVLDAIYTAYAPSSTPATPRPATSTTYTGAVDSETIERVQDALQQLSPSRCDDRSEHGGWIAVGFALRDLGAVGLQLWEQWSRGSHKFIPGECERLWAGFETSTEYNGTKRPKTLASLFEWARVDSAGAWSVAGWWRDKRRREREARRSSAAPSTAPTVAPSTPAGNVEAQRWPWELTPEDWRQCPLCSSWLHDGRHLGDDMWEVWYAHGYCHRACCAVWNKIRAGDDLAPITSWKHIYTGVVADAVKTVVIDQDGNEKVKWTGGQWRNVRAAVVRKGGQCLRIALGNNMVLAVANRPERRLTEVNDRAACIRDVLYPALLTSPWDRRVQMAGVKKDKAATGGKTPAASSTTETTPNDPAVFAELTKGQRITVLSEQIGGQREPTQNQALKRALKIPFGAEQETDLRSLWRLAGLEVNGRRARGTTEQIKHLLELAQELPREGLKQAMRQLVRRESGAPYASIDAIPTADGRMVNPATGEILDAPQAPTATTADADHGSTHKRRSRGSVGAAGGNDGCN